MYNLFLDDERSREQVTWVNYQNSDLPWHIAKNFLQFTEILVTYGIPEFVSFDHDLGNEHYAQAITSSSIDYTKFSEKAGYDCAKLLVSVCEGLNVPFPDYVVHSMNPIGKENIVGIIDSYKRYLENK